MFWDKLLKQKKKKKKTATEIKWPNISEENVDKGKHICKTHNLH